jgi:integrating conjugative element protein (TIGR03757 family)
MCRRLPVLLRPAHPALVLLFVTMFGSRASLAQGTDIWIVTDHRHPVHELAHARVIDLDAPTQIEATLSRGLPATPSEAAAEVRERLGNPAVTQQLTAAYQGVADAWRIGVTKIPAVVVDQRYVVYGDPDIAHAMTRIQAYRETHP